MGKNDLSISAIIPMYNAAKSIISAVKSVVNQEWVPENFELVIVDDGSTDSSKKIVENWIKKNQSKHDWPIILISKSNGGVSSARNRGIEAAKNKWIAFLDSDDIWVQDRLLKFKKIVASNPKIDFLGGNLTKDKTKIPFVGELPYLYRVSTRDLLIKWVPQTSTVTVKKSVLMSVGLYDENMKYAEDGDLYLRIATSFQYFVVQEQFAIYGSGKRMFGVSGLSGNLSGMLKGNIQVLNHGLHNKNISSLEYCVFYVWNMIKYIRRLVLTRR
jgi:glycosyltransferase involved in cell wall biosynthesis